jgi:hypothetical protein
MTFGNKLLLWLFLLFLHNSYADNIDDLFLSLFATYNQKIQKFAELYQNPDLKKPIKSSGILVYTKNKVLQRIQTKPTYQKISIKDELITIEEGGDTKILLIEDYPQFQQMFIIIDSILGGNKKKLQDIFLLSFDGNKTKNVLFLQNKKDKYPQVKIDIKQNKINTIKIYHNKNETRTIFIHAE